MWKIILLSFRMNCDFALMPNDDVKLFYLLPIIICLFVEFHFTNEAKTPLVYLLIGRKNNFCYNFLARKILRVNRKKLVNSSCGNLSSLKIGLEVFPFQKKFKFSQSENRKISNSLVRQVHHRKRHRKMGKRITQHQFLAFQ